MLSDSHKYFQWQPYLYFHIYDHLHIPCLKDISSGIAFCMHASLYVSVYLHIHAYIHVYKFIDIPTYAHVVLPKSIHPCICMYISPYIHLYICTDSSMSVYINTYMSYMYSIISVCLHAYMHTHTCKNT